MRYLLIIALLFNLPAFSQVISDTVYFSDGQGGYTKVITYRNASTTSFIPKIDTAAIIATKWKLDSTAAALATFTQTRLNDTSAAIRATVNSKQATLVSGTNIKTVNGNTLLGSGDVAISGTAAWGSVTGTLSNQTDLQNALNLKAPLASPTFTGSITFPAGSIANAALANGAVANLSGTNTGDQTTVSGNAGTATTLQTPRLINGQSFNGSADIGTEKDLLAYQALGSPVLAETVAQKLAYSNVSTAMVDGQIKYTAVYLPKAATLTGIKVYVRVLGAYTGDNNNRIGLYTYSGGTITLVASSANSATLWTSAANGVQTIPFSSTYAAAAGIYFVAFLYNQSAQTTAPALASGVALNNLVMGSTALGFTNSAKLYGTSTGTDIPASIAMSGITSSVIPSWVSLY